MKKKYKIKAFYLALLCVFNCVVLCFSFTIAWFTSVIQATNRVENGLRIQSIEYIESVVYHQFKDRGVDYIDFYSDEHDGQLDDGRNPADMGFYNLLDQNYQTLMEVTLTEDALLADALDLWANTLANQSHLSIGTDGKPVRPLVNASGEYNSLSSIVDLYVFFEDDLNINNDRIRVEKENNENVGISNFIDENNDLIEEKGFMMTRLIPSELPNAKFYILLDYNELNVNTMYGNNLGNEAIELGHFQQEDTDLPILMYAADFEFSLRLVIYDE